MKKLLIITGILLLFGFIGLIIRLLTFKGDGGKAVLKVNSTPSATIFLDNQKLGNTPFEDKVTTGEYILKLIPQTSTSVVSWEGKIKLQANVLTYINRDLGETELSSGGEILTLEKISGKQAQIAVVSIPDKAVVTVAGDEKGITPILLADIQPGSYELSISFVHYQSRTIKIKATAGYKLNASFQLIQTEKESMPTPIPQSSMKPSVKPTPKASPEPSVKPSSAVKTYSSPPPVPYVQILDTPTGFLRVRSQPSTSTGAELAKVHPDEYYPLLDEESGWYKIEYTDGDEGWIKSDYAQKFE